MRKLIVGTGWKMNIGSIESTQYVKDLQQSIAQLDLSNVEIFVLPPFTSMHSVSSELNGSLLSFGGQNMHWADSGAWTGEISASMLVEAGCRYVELAHSERLQHFGETYEAVRLKVDKAMSVGLTPIICLGETTNEKKEGHADEVLASQLHLSLAGQPDERVPEVILAYEPRWAIGSTEAATPEYIASRHGALRAMLAKHHGQRAADLTRIIYGGSVTARNCKDIVSLDNVDGLFVGRAALSPENFAKIIKSVVDAAETKGVSSTAEIT